MGEGAVNVFVMHLSFVELTTAKITQTFWFDFAIYHVLIRGFPRDSRRAPYDALAQILGRHFTAYVRPCYDGELYSLT